ncbi:MaoC family dehydratase [Pontivivens insulae]|uniref:Putative enoyl-CoA hydratase 1 n=1 Tax=Pontivivens insulae TaxID=1639689 RepID=A0A2R8ABB5_9RHOB|nr:MaoC family dehydratase [Pontivivens insulae]RED11305.1 acyl dehydratase [Pontivivens insulae]SPF29522.1 putative enoyl-CoA hydratase 1 [Pontivivens insulae]
MSLPHRNIVPLDDLTAAIGSRVGTSRWFEVTQDQIDAFATLTDDAQFIHVDPARAAQTPFGGTIAHGFLTLSMLSAMAYDAAPVPEGAAMGVNYGFDKVRFLSPVPAGARIRAQFDLTAVEVADPTVTCRMSVVVEIENAPKPALAAEWITRTYLAEG